MAAAIRESQSVFLDALPYVDQEYSSIPGIRAEVEKLVRDEMQSFKPKDYLAAFPAVPDLKFKDSLLAEDFERMAKKQKMATMDTKRYALEKPKDDEPSAAWVAAISNAQSQVQHQSVRIENLDLMSEHGPMAWRMHNTYLETVHAGLKQKLEATKTKIEEVNKKRKLDQTKGGRKVRELEMTWDDLAKKNLNIDAAVQSLDRDIERLCPTEEAVEAAE